jgi:outer membrane protein assembly factor BamB
VSHGGASRADVGERPRLVNQVGLPGTRYYTGVPSAKVSIVRRGLTVLAVLLVAITPPLARAQQQVTPPALPGLRVPPMEPAAPAAPGTRATLPWKVAVDVTLAASPAGLPVLAGDLLVTALRTGEIAAIAVIDGRPRWTATVTLPALLAATPDLAIVAEPDSVSARRLDSGDIAWRVPVEAPARALTAGAAGLVVAGFDSGTVLAWQVASGAVAWRVDAGAGVTHLMATESGAIAGLASGDVVAIASTGGVRWTRTLAGAISALGTGPGAVFAGSTDNYLYKLDADRGAIDWRWRTGGDVVGTPVVAGRVVYFVSLDALLRALDAGNGAQQWKRALASRPLGGPLLLDDAVVVTDVGPVVEGFAAAGGRDRGRLDEAGEFVAPVVAWRDDAGAVSLVALGRNGRFLRYDRVSKPAPDTPPISAPPLAPPATR